MSAASASNDGDGDASPTQVKELNFHRDFAVKQPGDVILQADDGKTHFFFPLHLLSGLSSFFRNLPTATANDRHDGVAVIPLADASPEGLTVVLDILRFLLTIHPQGVVSDGMYPYSDAELLDAAHIAGVYDIPAVVGIMINDLPDANRNELRYALAALGNADDNVLGSLRERCTERQNLPAFTPLIREALGKHATRAWQQLKDRYIALASAFANLAAACGPPAEDYLHRCVLCGANIDTLLLTIIGKLKTAETVLDIKAVNEWRYEHIRCPQCHRSDSTLARQILNDFYGALSDQW